MIMLTSDERSLLARDCEQLIWTTQLLRRICRSSLLQADATFFVVELENCESEKHFTLVEAESDLKRKGRTLRDLHGERCYLETCF
jgi:hypothetical protein